MVALASGRAVRAVQCVGQEPQHLRRDHAHARARPLRHRPAEYSHGEYLLVRHNNYQHNLLRPTTW